MKSSIRLKLTFGIIGLTLFFIVLSIIFNSFFIEKYYVYQTKKTILDLGRSLEHIENKQENIIDEIEKIERTKGVRIFILSNDFSKIFEIMNSNQTRMIFPRRDDRPPPNRENPPQERRGEMKRNALERFKSLVEPNKEKIATNKYIYNEYFDKRIGTKLIEVIYLLDSKNYIIISKPLIALRESANIAVRFFMFSGMLTLIFGILFSIIFSRKFTKPIAELNTIAKEMANMNFTKKYEGKTTDEIAELGGSINTLSEKLDKTIRELLEVNEKLKKEVEHERQLEKMRKEFVSSVSHELKTPVSLIQGYAEGLKYNVNDDEESKTFYCDVIVDESNKMNKLITELLNLAQIESGHYKMEKNNGNFSDLIVSIFEKYEMIFREKEIKTSLKIEDKITLNFDEHRIEQVVVNYINNAINHIDKNKRIDINVVESEDKVRLEVYNSGKNIPEESIERIWESFYKVDQARTREYGGTGLGLSICRAILEQHNALYGVENLKDGVLFWFELEK